MFGTTEAIHRSEYLMKLETFSFDLYRSGGTPFYTQFGLNFSEEIIVDLFAGGGGASTGLEMGLQRDVAIAINHNPAAISMHQANHPFADHYPSDVWAVDPVVAVAGRPVGWLHLSPDCTHHSQAAGGQPRKKEIRDLAWVALKWAGKVRPRVITLENVKQILQWGRLVAKRCPVTGRVITLDKVPCPKTGRMINRVAHPGERVPRENQYLVPDRKRRGTTWRRFIRALEKLGYQVDYWVLKNCNYGDPTSRERLYLVARCDGVAPRKPEQTHFEKPARGQKAWRTAAECIDWSDMGQSIFTRKKPLADATLRRVAKGIKREVLDRAKPFLVPIANWSRETINPVDTPLNTITAWPRGGSFSLVSPTLVQVGYGERKGQSPRVPGLHKPLGTVVAGGVKHGLVSAFLAQANGGFNTTHSRAADAPLSTVTNTGSQQQLVVASLAHLRNNCDGRAVDDPLFTISAGGNHHALVSAFLSRQFGGSIGQAADAPAPTVTAGGGGKTALVECVLSPEAEKGALRVAGFLLQYYSEGGQWGALDKPLGTITTKDRLALVTVWIAGDPYVIVDIRLRMLKPPELYRAQGFPPNYIIDRGHDGRPFTKSQQTHMCGNSVSPGTMAAIARANDPWRVQSDEREAA